MKALLLTIGALAATLSLAVGLSSASAANSSTVTGTKVAVAGTGLGKVLVDGRGHTLYLFAKDRRGKSSCTGTCAGFWPPLIAAGKPRAAAGAKASLLGTTKRADGRLQVTYNHHPLYTFVKDTKRRPDKRRGSRRLRRRVVRRHNRRSKGRESRRGEQRRRRLPARGRLRDRVLGVTAHARRGPSAGPLLNRALPLAPPPAPDRRLTDLHNLFIDAVEPARRSRVHVSGLKRSGWLTA